MDTLGTRCLTCLVLTVAVLAAQPVAAETDPTTLGLFAGVTELEPDLADDGSTFGLRVSRPASDRYEVEITVGYFEGDLLSEDGSSDLSIGYEGVYVDLNENLIFNSKGKVRPFLTFGVGWAWPSIDGDVAAEDLGPVYAQFESDTFTANGGVGLQFQLGDKVIVRPEVRAKWYEVRRRDDVDFAATLGIGFVF
jgi:hypothetical protein